MSTTPSLQVLIVDDENIVHETLGGFLHEFGHQVESAWDGNEALEILQAKDFDLVLIDVRMPGMNGLALLEKVREIRPRLATVIITGHGDPAMAEEATRLGVLDFLIKPIRLAELLNILAKVT